MLDSNIASELLPKRSALRDRAKRLIQSGHKIGIAAPVVGELYGGVEYSATRERNLAALNRELRRWLVWPFDLSAAYEYGKLYAKLRRAGRPIQHIDIQIAAIAISIGDAIVVTRDSDFTAIPELRCEAW